MFRRFFLSFTVLAALGRVIGQYAPVNVDTTLRDMINAMNTSVNPCDDFYEYTCGRWYQQNPIPLNLYEYSEAVKSAERTQLRAEDILLQPYDKPDDSEIIKLARAYYRSCRNETAIEARGLQPILQILAQNGGWPLLTENLTTPTKNWQAIHTIYTRLYNTGALYNIKLHPDLMNNSRMDIRIDLRISYPLLDAAPIFHPNVTSLLYTDVYRDIIYDFIKESGSHLTIKVLTDLLGLLAFQRNLPFAKQLRTGPQVTAYEKLTIKELQEYYDNNEARVEQTHINFLMQIKTIFKEISEKINEDTVVQVFNKHHFHVLKSILRNTPQRTILNYVHWNMIANLLPYTTQKMRTLLHVIQNPPIHKQTPEKMRWQVCMDEVRPQEALSLTFAKKYANNHVIQKINDMAPRIRDQIKRRVSQSPNFNDEGKEFLIKKLDALNFVIGYPKWYANQSVTTELYAGLTVGPNYFDNVVNFRLFESKKKAQLYGKQVDQYSPCAYSTTINPCYYGPTNTIGFPLARFMDDFPDITTPDFLVYSRVGTVLGHEITHAIVGDGWEFDEKGARHSVDGTTPEGQKNSQCFIDQYNKYIVHETGVAHETVYVDGALTLEENLADILGIQASYDAFLAAKRKINQTALQLPRELAYLSEHQLYFVSHALTLCETVRPASKLIGLNSDPHAPNRYRVIGSLSNSAGFASAFGCRRNTNMNPTKKCLL